MASASVPLKAFVSVPLKAPASVPMKASASVSLRASASSPVKASAASVSEQRKLSGHTKLIGSKSDYVFIRYAGPEELKSCDRIDVGLFGRSWVANISWSVVFAPGIREDTWRDYLTSQSAKENFMDTGDLLDVIASGSSNGLFFAVDEKGYHQRAVHGFRTVVSLNEYLKTNARVQSGGSLFLKIGLISIMDSGFDIVADSDFTFDGQVFWNLYSN